MASLSDYPDRSQPFTIYPARLIRTLFPARPEVSAVAIQGDRVLGLGSVEELAGWGDHEVDDTFSDRVLVPGFVEGHSHVLAGGMWSLPYVGYFDRRDPKGKTWGGCQTIDSVLDRLREAAALLDDDHPLVAWGFDPMYLGDARLGADELDQVSLRRPIFVFHASAHLASVNSAMLERGGITAATTTPGVGRRADGSPNGELQEPPAMMLARDGLATVGRASQTEDAKWNYAFEARNAGVTTLCDLGTSQVSDPAQVAAWSRAVNDPAYPCRVVVATSSAFGGVQDPDQLAAIGREVMESNSAKLRFGVVKLVLDGSIQGFTARLRWPFYFRPPEGHPGNGQWLIPPDQLSDVVEAFHRAGLTVHCHCNGDQASEVFINAVEEALRRHPRADHRHTVQHCQMTTPAQYRRMATLGIAANIFANHLFYWGDQHRDLTLGPARADYIDACATAIGAGVEIALHSDAPVTPFGPLHTMWCAVNRTTASGVTLGAHERITAAQALRAVTLGPAFQMHLDHEVGSLEPGKFADIAILDDDPLSVDPSSIRDVGVVGTMLGGRLTSPGS